MAVARVNKDLLNWLRWAFGWLITAGRLMCMCMAALVECFGVDNVRQATSSLLLITLASVLFYGLTPGLWWLCLFCFTMLLLLQQVLMDMPRVTVQESDPDIWPCIMCSTHIPTTVLVPCGHALCCECSEQLRQRGGGDGATCPTCNEKVHRLVPVKFA